MCVCISCACAWSICFSIPPADAQAVDVTTVVVTSDSAVISWQLPPSATGDEVELTRFVVTVLPVGSPADPEIINVAVGSSDGTYGVTLLGLAPPGGRYELTIGAEYSNPDLDPPARDDNATVLFTFQLLGVGDGKCRG